MPVTASSDWHRSGGSYNKTGLAPYNPPVFPTASVAPGSNPIYPTGNAPAGAPVAPAGTGAPPAGQPVPSAPSSPSAVPTAGAGKAVVSGACLAAVVGVAAFL